MIKIILVQDFCVLVTRTSGVFLMLQPNVTRKRESNLETNNYKHVIKIVFINGTNSSSVRRTQTIL